jgi:hypothetical protein
MSDDWRKLQHKKLTAAERLALMVVLVLIASLIAMSLLLAVIER